MQLSPFAISEIKFRAGMTAEPRPKPKAPREVIRWECPECGDLHYCESDAADCCALPPQDETSSDPTCPVCGDSHHDHHAAANCCLWKDLDIAARMKIAAAAESGVAWMTALDIK